MRRISFPSTRMKHAPSFVSTRRIRSFLRRRLRPFPGVESSRLALLLTFAAAASSRVSILSSKRQYGLTCSQISVRPTSRAGVQRSVRHLRPRKGGANRPAAIQLGGGLNVRAGAVAAHSTESGWTDGKKAHAQWEQQEEIRRR